MSKYANIIIDISHEKVDRPFQYLVPEELEIQLKPGMQVRVPFGNGNREIAGYVIELTDEAEFDTDRMKEIKAIDTDKVSMEARLIALASWIRRNYGGTMNQALKTVLPIRQKSRQKEKRFIELTVSKEEGEEKLALFEKKHSTARARLLGALLEEPRLPYEVVTGKLNVTAVVIRTLEEMGLLTVKKEQVWRNPIHFLTDERLRKIRNAAGSRKRRAKSLGKLLKGLF